MTTATRQWVVTNGLISMDLCRTCGQPYRSGHINCSCDQNHPDPCDRPAYDALQDQLATSRRIAGDNADLVVKAVGALAEIMELAEQLPIDPVFTEQVRLIARRGGA